MVNELKRVIYRKFVADVQCGAQTDPTAPAPMISLRWSNDRGASWSNYITQPLGAVGDFLQQVQFWRLGLSRDRVFELSWSSAVMTALNGAYIEVEQSAS